MLMHSAIPVSTDPLLGVEIRSGWVGYLTGGKNRGQNHRSLSASHSHSSGDGTHGDEETPEAGDVLQGTLDHAHD